MPDPMNKKHAYLIMAHTNFPQLQKLITLLDHPLNDIYLHVDKRATSFQPERIKTSASNLIIIDRIRVNWGGHSQIQCEMNLLKASAPKHYRYYHLISGFDLPLRSQDEIHAFFEDNYPENFIDFHAPSNESKSFLYRIEQYHLFKDLAGRNRGLMPGLFRRANDAFVKLQKLAGFKRTQYIPPYKGTNWFSITDELAQYVVSQDALVKKQFYYSHCADEVFLHSLAMAAPCRDTVIDNCLRAIDWERGDPYVFRQEDVEDLLASANLFARKFDSKIDPQAIDHIVAHLTKNQ